MLDVERFRTAFNKGVGPELPNDRARGASQILGYYKIIVLCTAAILPSTFILKMILAAPQCGGGGLMQIVTLADPPYAIESSPPVHLEDFTAALAKCPLQSSKGSNLRGCSFLLPRSSSLLDKPPLRSSSKLPRRVAKRSGRPREAPSREARCEPWPA